MRPQRKKTVEVNTCVNQSTGLLFDITSSLASLNSEFQIKRSIIPAESYPLECMATFDYRSMEKNNSEQSHNQPQALFQTA